MKVKLKELTKKSSQAIWNTIKINVIKKLWTENGFNGK